MKFYENQRFSKLIKQFHISTQLRYSGKLDIKNSQGKSWSLYYQFGQLIWATGGTHPHRRWMRNINQVCPYLDLNKINIDAKTKTVDYWDYLILAKLYKNNILQSEQVNKIVVNTFKEIFFDIYQQVDEGNLTFIRNPEKVLDVEIISSDSRMLWEQVQLEWNNWVKAGLSSISPHLSPVLIRPENLHHEVSLIVYQNFQRLMNGKYTLYDLSIKTNQSILDITRSLSLYIRKGIIELRTISDIALPFQKYTSNNANKLGNYGKVPLIACVDDSSNFCKLLEQIITANGINCITFQDSVQALPNLIISKPDLIFLDLMMPVVNGYELCAQLRCSSIFASTPIIILTASDGVFDQARAKVYGATDFMTKSITRKKLLLTINKYLQIKIPDDIQTLVS